MEHTRRLSIWRILFAVLLLVLISVAAYFGVDRYKETTVMSSINPWFAPYVDVTATPRYPFEQFADKQAKTAVLAFIVSLKDDACTPSWGGVYNLQDASTNLDLDRRIARLRQKGGNVVISFGGLLNDELSVNCKDPTKLMNAYKEVVNRYTIDTIDLDLENSGLTDTEAMKRRAEVISTLQKERRAEGKNLAVWLTLPVAPFGMTLDGTNAISEMLSHGVDLAGVNVMTMDYGESKESTHTMRQASERALIETHRQLTILYKQAGITLNEASVWAKIGATPMIGQNDVPGEIFTLEDAHGFNEFSSLKGIGRMSMWSANRDLECGENYVNLTVVSDSCSGVKQDKFAFSTLLSKNFTGDISQNAALVTVQNTETKQLPDNPQESPYEIWNETSTYLEGTKVVWHQNVYEAKWWTQGDLPDNPVLQSWETPWQLIGPVLPGETPIPMPTLPPNTYPEWSGITIYEANQVVLFNGVPYKSKWWTQGDSPAAATSNPDSSPWKVLTREQLDEEVPLSN